MQRQQSPASAKANDCSMPTAVVGGDAETSVSQAGRVNASINLPNRLVNGIKPRLTSENPLCHPGARSQPPAVDRSEFHRPAIHRAP